MQASSSSNNSLSESDAAALDAEIKSTLIPCQEYLLQGSILVEHVDKLLELLRALCDNCEGGIETFQVYEACYCAILKSVDWLKLRVRQSLIHPDEPNTIRYVGMFDLGAASEPTAVRTSVDVRATGDVVDFVETLRFRKEFGFMVNGYAFKKGRMNITVSRIIKAKEMDAKIYGGRHVSNSYLVEMSVVEPAGRSATGAEMRQFADRLKPLVYMTKPDLNLINF